MVKLKAENMFVCVCGILLVVLEVKVGLCFTAAVWPISKVKFLYGFGGV